MVARRKTAAVQPKPFDIVYIQWLDAGGGGAGWDRLMDIEVEELKSICTVGLLLTHNATVTTVVGSVSDVGEGFRKEDAVGDSTMTIPTNCIKSITVLGKITPGAQWLK